MKLRFFLLFVYLHCYVCVPTKNSTLELLHIIFRHGDRTPDKVLLYPKDPYLNETFDPVGYGQMTNVGKLKLYKLGQMLHERYNLFLETYTFETLDARSTDYNRTKVSMQLVLASLFPPQNDSIWNEDLKWQPIPSNYWNLKNDHVLGHPYRNCPKYRKNYFDFLNSKEGIKMYENYTQLAEYLKIHSGINATAKNMFELYLTLQMEAEFGLELPEWTKTVFPKAMKNLVFSEYKARVATPEMKKLSAGFLLKKIIRDTQQKIKNKLPKKRKLFLYSGHEYNLIYLLQVLEVFYSHIPPYTACIIVEIHNFKGVRKVKIFYKEEENMRLLKLPKCDNFCPFKKIVKLYKKYLPKSDKECKL